MKHEHGDEFVNVPFGKVTSNWSFWGLIGGDDGLMIGGEATLLSLLFPLVKRWKQNLPWVSLNKQSNCVKIVGCHQLSLFLLLIDFLIFSQAVYYKMFPSCSWNLHIHQGFSIEGTLPTSRCLLALYSAFICFLIFKKNWNLNFDLILNISR